MKKYNTLFVVIFTVLFLMLLTWLLPVTYLNGTFVSDVRAQMGIMDLFTYPSYLIYNFIYILIYVLLVGVFYGVLNKTGAYRQILDSIVKFLKGKEVIFLCILTLLVSTVVSFTGFTYEAILFFPFIIAIVLMLGHNKITASLVTIGPVMTGIMGSTFSKLVTGTYNDILNSNATIVGYTDLIWAKLAVLVVTNIILIVYTILYVKYSNNKVEKTVETEDKDDSKEEVVEIEDSMFIPSKPEEKTKKWPLVTILVLTFLIIVISTINWTDAFQITFFTDILTKIDELTIGGYPVIPKILGSLVAFGNWSYNEYMVLLFIVIAVIKFVYHIKAEELFDSVFDGLKNYIYAATVVFVSYTILITTSNHPVMLTILKPLLELTDGFNMITLSIGTLFSALFNTDLGFHRYSILPLTYVTSYINDTSVYGLCGLITQSMNGLALLVAPTSAVLLFNLSTLKITYFEWLKKVGLLFVALLAVLMITFTIILLII